MAKVSFFTPVSFGNQPKSNTEWLLEKVDGYFYLGGRKAHIIKINQETKAVLVNENQSCAMTCFKVASYFTIALPTVMLITKAILRYTHYYDIDTKSINPAVIDTLGLNLDEEATVDETVIDED